MLKYVVLHVAPLLLPTVEFFHMNHSSFCYRYSVVSTIQPGYSCDNPWFLSGPANLSSTIVFVDLKNVAEL